MICSSCKKDNPASRWSRVKSWIVWHFFAEEMIDERSASSTQSFSKGYDYGKNEDKALHELTIQAFKDEISRLKTFKPVDMERMAVKLEEVFTEKGRKLFLGNNPLTDQQAQILKDEAIQFKKTALYSVFYETLKHQAINKGLSLSQNYEDILASKMILYNLEEMRKIVGWLSIQDLHT